MCPAGTMYSIARTTGKLPRDIEGSNRVVQRVLDIIAYFKPIVATIENPATGMLKQQPMMQHIDSHVLSYCMYGDSGFRKLTQIWHLGRRGLPNFMPKCCAHTKRCESWCSIAKRHPRTFSSRRGIQGEIVTVPKAERYRLPQQLVEELLEEAAKEVVQYRDDISMLHA